MCDKDSETIIERVFEKKKNYNAVDERIDYGRIYCK